MSKLGSASVLAAALTLSASGSAVADAGRPPKPSVETGYFAADPEITLRRMVVRSPAPKGAVLLLHGFPETLYAWTGVSLALAEDYDVHAFDWPGFGRSTRPAPDRFAYAPRDYARVLKAYIDKAGLDRSRLTIYATDIGALPALLLALDEPDIAQSIIVGDFAPFDRPEHMYDSLRSLKAEATAQQARALLNRNRDEILQNTFRRGLPESAQFEISHAFRRDMEAGWGAGAITSADAFYHYYSNFTRDQHHLEANMPRLRTPVRVIWGAEDLYIDKAMGEEFARKVGVDLTILSGVGHYPHLQVPARTLQEIRAAAR